MDNDHTGYVRVKRWFYMLKRTVRVYLLCPAHSYHGVLPSEKGVVSLVTPIVV